MKVATVSVGGERRVGQGIDNGRSIAPSISEARREALAHAEKADHRLIDCPTLIVTGDEDAVGPATVARELADKIGGARTVILHRCGHWTPIEKSKECGTLLSEFLRGIPIKQQDTL